MVIWEHNRAYYLNSLVFTHDSFETGGQNLFKKVLAPNLLLQLLSLWDDIFNYHFPFQFRLNSAQNFNVRACVGRARSVSLHTSQPLILVLMAEREYSIASPLRAHIPEQKNRLQHTAPAHARAALHTHTHTHTHTWLTHTLRYCGLKSLWGKHTLPQRNNTHIFIQPP